MNEEFFEKLREKARVYSEGIDPCHDMCHTERVLSLALSIGKKEGADLEILEVATLLHDIARKEQADSKGAVCHAERGAELSKDILSELDYPEDKIEKVVRCIETHRFRKSNVPESIEAKVLYDADKLDGIGAIGVARAISFSGSIGAKVHVADVDIEKSAELDEDDCGYKEFLVKLVRVKDKMMTESGKEFAQERHNFMVEFFDRLNKEVAGEL